MKSSIVAKKYSKDGKPLTGFTLIETLIYIALFTIIIGGGMLATYQIIQSTSAGYNRIVIGEESNFLLRKIDWALTGLTGSQSITTPSTSIPYSDTTLLITKNISGVLTQITFNLSGGNLTIQEGSSAAIVTLNSSNVTVSLTPSVHLFSRIVGSGEPDEIVTSFTFTTVQNGRNVSQDFSTTKYLRK